MKFFIFIFLSLPSIFRAQAEEDYLIQNIDIFSRKLPDWTKIESKITRAEKLKLINLVRSVDSAEYYYCQYKTCEDQEFFDNYVSDFHFVDLNNDSFVDVIFSGKSSSDYESVNIYINKNTGCKKVFSKYGKIVLSKNRSFVIYEPPCCAMTENVLIYYRINKDSVSASSQICFHRPFDKCAIMIIPKLPVYNKEIEITEKMDIRFGAQDKPGGKFIFTKSLIIAKTKPGTKAKVFGAYTDKTGQKWSFIKLKYPDVIQKENFPKATMVGWIKTPD